LVVRVIEPPRVIVISGLPGAGKSSVAHLLAQQFPRAVHVEADVLQNMIVSGASGPDSDLSPESERQLRLRATHGCQLADSFARAGFCAVLDDIFIGDRIDHLRTDLHTRPFHFVMLNPSLPALRTRNATRTKRDAYHQSERLFDVVQSQTAWIGLWLDTSALDAAQTVEKILATLSSAVVD
jgi:predicted kinase